MRKVVLLLAALLVLIPVAGADIADEIRTLDGSGNNGNHPEWGKTNTQYLRVARTNYADGIAKPVGGPPTRYVSNRVFNDVHQNLFSENGVTQWGFVWGQFMDHTFGLRQEAGGETANIPFNTADPLETFTNTWARFRSCVRRPRRVRGPERRRGSRSTRSRATSTVLASTVGPPTGSNGCARGRWTETSPTTARSCCLTTASCPAAVIRGASVCRRPRWR